MLSSQEQDTSTKYSKTILGTSKLNLLQKLELLLFGRASLGKHSLPGWTGELEFYLFRCEKHGVVIDYPHGTDEELRCSLCTQTAS
ncbi:MAG: hypothetical protein ACYCQJ_02430 [Nitrososphaerales archaeon]